MKKSLEQITKEDSRYNPSVIRFVYEGLGQTVQNVTTIPPHVNGQTLCEGLKKLAVDRWGRLAMLVLNSWGVKTTRDFGEIVFLLVKNGWMQKEPNDCIEDFDEVYEFTDAFKRNFEIPLDQ